MVIWITLGRPSLSMCMTCDQMPAHICADIIMSLLHHFQLCMFLFVCILPAA
jgi:hypothetical protein